MDMGFLREFTGGGVRDAIMGMDSRILETAREIRIRRERPLIFCGSAVSAFVDKQGRLTQNATAAYRPTAGDIQATLEHLSGFSLYAFEEELRNGYITIPGGHRVGICGRTAVENGRVKTIGSVSSLNIRVTHQVTGCGEGVMEHISSPSGAGIMNTMIISPPGCGKTTLLRDIIRIVSDGGGVPGRNVGVADERSEIAGSWMGVPQNDVGTRTDVLDGCPKAEGMLMLLRSMSPSVIAADEIGGAEDAAAIGHIANAGVKLICTAHGYSTGDVGRRQAFAGLFGGGGVFERFVVLAEGPRPGIVAGIYDGGFKEVWGGGDGHVDD